MQIKRTELDQLPNLCLCCVAPAEHQVERRFAHHPAALYLFLLPGILPYFLLRPWWTERCVLRLPLCRKHRNHWRWRRIVAWSGAVVFTAVTAVGVWMLRTMPESRDAIVVTLTVGIDGLWLWFLLALALKRTSIRASSITRERITLEGVAPHFVETMQQQRAARGEPLEVQRCARCGLESPLLNAFHRQKKKLYCPRCWVKRQERFLVKVLFAEVGVAALGIGLLLAAPLAPRFQSQLAMAGWGLINLALVAFTEMLVTAPHEAGHALAAWLLGARVFRIWIGSGKTIAERKVAGLPVEIKMIPLGGMTLFGLPEIRWFRTRKFLIVLAGPLVHVLLLGLLALWRPPADWFEDRFFHEFAPLEAFVIANLLVLAVNLLPFKTQAAGNVVVSDGLNLLTTPFMSSALIRKIHALFFAVEGAEYLKARDYRQAAACYERGLQSGEEQAAVRINLGVALLHLAKLIEARQQWLIVLQTRELDSRPRALVMNNIAAVDVLLHGSDTYEHAPDAEVLAEADRFSSEARQCIPWSPYTAGTRGCVLVEQGRLDEGKALLESAMREQEDDSAKAFIACFLAIAACREGQRQQAQTFIDTAEKLRPDHIGLGKARKVLAESRTPQLGRADAPVVVANPVAPM